MGTTTVPPKTPTAKPPRLTLQDIVVVDDAGDRIKGEDLARLLAFAKAWERGDRRGRQSWRQGWRRPPR